MAGSRRTTRKSKPERHGVLGSLLGGATDIMQSVASEVAPGVVGALDVDDLIQRVDMQAVLDRIDLDALLARIDVDALVARIDVQALIDRVDVRQIVARIDIDAVVERVDIDALVGRTQLDSIIARSSAGVAGKVLDVARSNGVGLDGFIHRWVDRVLRRDRSSYPSGPPLLVNGQRPYAS